MTAHEVFEKITSEPKWYAKYTSAPHASLLVKRFKAGTLEFKTLEKLFNSFDYHLTASWDKKDEVKEIKP